tara:strand:- start:97 stop:726 length:630 start_codon:yes stop_codon:yes gene_type:complete
MMEVSPETLTSKDPTTASANLDPFNQPIPGQSLTTAPRQFPHENPPDETDPEIVLNELREYLNTPEVKDELVAQMAAGFPVEAIVTMIAKGGVAQGRFSPDVAEIIKPVVTMLLISLALDQGITELVVFTEEPVDQEAEEAGIEERMYTTMRNLRPEMHSHMKGLEARGRMADMAAERKERISAKRKIANLDEQNQVPSDGSFLDIGEV